MQDIGLARLSASARLSKQVRTGANGRGQGLAAQSLRKNSEKRPTLIGINFAFYDRRRPAGVTSPGKATTRTWHGHRETMDGCGPSVFLQAKSA